MLTRASGVSPPIKHKADFVQAFGFRGARISVLISDRIMESGCDTRVSKNQASFGPLIDLSQKLFEDLLL